MISKVFALAPVYWNVPSSGFNWIDARSKFPLNEPVVPPFARKLPLMNVADNKLLPSEIPNELIPPEMLRVPPEPNR